MLQRTLIQRDEGVEYLKTIPPQYKNNYIQFLLDSNIKLYGKGVLSADLKTATTTLSGSFLLQASQCYVL